MAQDSVEILNIDLEKIVACDSTRIFKNESFIKDTKSAIDIDKFLSELCDGILLQNLNIDKAYIVSTIDGINSFFFRFGKTTNNEKAQAKDIVFYKFITKDEIKHEDKRFYRLAQKKSIDVNIQTISAEQEDFTKLYILSNQDKVNFPLLNKEQEKIVTQENNNVLVQGVAGSGKTNICIDRIVYAASRRYRGKIIYSTYSHALLMDTKDKVLLFGRNIKEFIEKWENNQVVFIGKDKKKRQIKK